MWFNEYKINQEIVKLFLKISLISHFLIYRIIVLLRVYYGSDYTVFLRAFQKLPEYAINNRLKLPCCIGRFGCCALPVGQFCSFLHWRATSRTTLWNIVFRYLKFKTLDPLLQGHKTPWPKPSLTTKAMKSSPLLGPFCGSDFLGFSLLKI